MDNGTKLAVMKFIMHHGCIYYGCFASQMTYFKDVCIQISHKDVTQHGYHATDVLHWDVLNQCVLHFICLESQMSCIMDVMNHSCIALWILHMLTETPTAEHPKGWDSERNQEATSTNDLSVSWRWLLPCGE